MTLDLPLLKCGHCEPLKLGVHAGALGLAAICAAYNTAAWLSRRENHLAVNAVLYLALAMWEHQHVAHHLKEIRRAPGAAALDGPAPPAITAVPAAA
jgi:hypothetical protein